MSSCEARDDAIEWHDEKNPEKKEFFQRSTKIERDTHGKEGMMPKVALLV